MTPANVLKSLVWGVAGLGLTSAGPASSPAYAKDADLLIHDTQYTSDEYVERIGWGHSSIEQCLTFARLARVKHLIAFHHDPARADDALYRVVSEAAQGAGLPFRVTAGAEGDVFKL